MLVCAQNRSQVNELYDDLVAEYADVKVNLDTGTGVDYLGMRIELVDEGVRIRMDGHLLGLLNDWDHNRYPLRVNDIPCRVSFMDRVESSALSEEYAKIYHSLVAR